MASGDGQTGTEAGPVTVVGVVSDTHGLLRPEVLAALAGCDLILHAGDIGTREVLAGLAAVAPVTAVRGNTDRAELLPDIPLTEVAVAGGRFLYLLHDLHRLDLDPAAAGMAVVISGHTHQPACFDKDGVLYLNPGSCGPRRFRCPVSLARLRIAAGTVTAELVELAPPSH